MDTFTQVSSVQFNTAAMMKDNFSIEKKYTFPVAGKKVTSDVTVRVPVQKNSTTYSQCFNKCSTFSITPTTRTLNLLTSHTNYTSL